MQINTGMRGEVSSCARQWRQCPYVTKAFVQFMCGIAKACPTQGTESYIRFHYQWSQKVVIQTSRNIIGYLLNYTHLMVTNNYLTYIIRTD